MLPLKAMTMGYANAAMAMLDQRTAARSFALTKTGAAGLQQQKPQLQEQQHLAVGSARDGFPRVISMDFSGQIA